MNSLLKNNHVSAFSTALNAIPAAADIPSSARASLLQCASTAEFEVRFWNAPNWVLERIDSALRKIPHVRVAVDEENYRHAWMYPDCWVRELREMQAADKAARQFAADHPFEARRLPFKDLRAAFKRGEVIIADGPQTTNWDFADDHPGEYTDSAWTSSKEIHEGVWSEARHACMGRTRRWTVIRPVLPLALRS
jgi:hypothetical protein